MPACQQNKNGTCYILVISNPTTFLNATIDKIAGLIIRSGVTFVAIDPPYKNIGRNQTSH
jgi:hypothetical protein